MKTSSYRAVIFDLWETLVPLPKALRQRSSSLMMAALEAPADEFAQAWLEARTVRETGDLEQALRQVCADVGLTPTDAQVARAVEIRQQTQAEAFRSPRPDALATLEALRQAKYLIGLVSNTTSETITVVEESPFASLLDAAVYSCREGSMKPDPPLYLRAASLLALRPDQCVYVGDGSDNELDGARRVGMRPVLLEANGLPIREWNGERVSSLGELVELLNV